MAQGDARGLRIVFWMIARAMFVTMGRAIRRVARRHPKKTIALAAWLLYTIGFVIWFRAGPDLAPHVDRAIVNDVTAMNPIEVRRIAYPANAAEVQRIMSEYDGPIAIGGGHYSMGGQTACEGCLSLDMRHMNHVLGLDVANKRVRVEAGIRWRDIQELIDRHGLAIRIMQTYSSFTVGGALSVNCHGRYIGEGPLIRSVEAIKLVLADGSLVSASPQENSELFYGAIGGYGGIGVIVEATLRLADNANVERRTHAMPITQYGSYFRQHIRDSRSAIFHNVDLYPPAYTTAQSVTWSETTRPLTVSERFVPRARPSLMDQLMLYVVSEVPGGKRIRSALYDPWLYRNQPVTTRNHEASYDVLELEPRSRETSTYVLQEYFVPVARLDEFVPKMRRILNEHEVNALNLSIRHARPDPGSLMAWAREEMFCFVLYYKQDTTPESRAHVARWTRELIDAVLSVNGTYYLPYQPHATHAQFRRAYPRFEEFVSLKARVDPHYRFRNTLWDTYLPPTQDAQFRALKRLRQERDALRDEGQTFLTLPEWYIVFSAEEYAQHLSRRAPSSFPYFGSNAQFWSSYRTVYHRTRGTYPPNTEYHTMNCVIGVSYSLENLIKGVYENTVGRITEWFADAGGATPATAEDRYAAQVAAEYNTFIRTYPWYDFPYAAKLKELWNLDSSRDVSFIRKWERLFILSVEYGAKAVYAGAIGAASHSAFGVEELSTIAWIHRPAGAALPQGVSTVATLGDGEEIVTLPRYEGFRDASRALYRNGIELRKVAGNSYASMTVVAPRGFHFARSDGEVTTRWDVLTDPARERALIFMPVSEMHRIVPSLEARGLTIDHVFDF